MVILSHRVWRDRFAADPEILGRTVRIYGRPTLGVGVMPAGPQVPRAQDLWLPLGAWPGRRLDDKEMGVFVFGRLGAGIPLNRTLDGVLAEAAFSCRLSGRFSCFSAPWRSFSQR